MAAESYDDADRIAAAGGGGEDRVLTIPNALSLIRLACIPVFVWLLFGRDDRYGAAILLGVLGATDWVDGYVARHFNQVSTVGKVLDPMADRLLLGVGVAAILIDGSVPAWFAWAVIVREVLVSAAVLVLAALGAKRIDVQWVGKAGTFANMVAFPLFLVAASRASWADLAHVLAWVIGLVGLAMSWYAAAAYLPLARRALAEGRATTASVDAGAAE
ncbi:MAG TPA: CDP-alcohol phosphatidyltransferase family protein [Acidimicrobiales bacterium]|nr:CDP-alcohol phosphatidyltransferase family protein [Acidimicrobiales bacterium]